MKRRGSHGAPRIGRVTPPRDIDVVRGRRKPAILALVDLEGRDPKDFKLSTHAQGALRRFAEFAERADPAAIIRGAFPRECRIMREQAAVVRAWLERLDEEAGR